MRDVGSQAVEDALFVLGRDPKERGTRDRELAGVGLAVLVAYLAIHRPRLVGSRRDPPITEAHGAIDGLAGATAHVDPHGVLGRPGRHPDGLALIFERFARPRLAEEGDELLHGRASAGVVDAEHGEVRLHVRGGHGGVEAALEAEVCHRELLGQPHRVVQRGEQNRDLGSDLLRPAAHRCHEDQRSGQVAVGRLVVLAEHDAPEAVFVGPLDDVQGGGVLLASRSPELGRVAEVEGEYELRSAARWHPRHDFRRPGRIRSVIGTVNLPPLVPGAQGRMQRPPSMLKVSPVM